MTRIEANRIRRGGLFGGLSAASVAVGVLGVLPLVVSAARAMVANASDEHVAVPLVLVGLAAVLGLLLGASALLKESNGAIKAAATVGVCVSALVGLVALVFALSFHW